jgi:hypothetical protein
MIGRREDSQSEPQPVAVGHGAVDGVTGISGGEVGGTPIGSVPGLGTCSGNGEGSSGGKSGCGVSSGVGGRAGSG